MSKHFTIEAESPEVEKELENLHNLISTAGGAINPAVTVRQSGREISVHSSLDAGSSEILFDIPWHCLPNQGLFSMGLENNDIVIQKLNGECPNYQRELQESMIAIYNLTGKIASQKVCDPKLALWEDRELLDKLYSARPQKAHIQSELEGNPKGYFALRSFLMSRVLRRDSATGSTSPTPLLMPFVDYLNHHPEGADYQVVKEKDEFHSLRARNAQCNPDSDESFACYGRHYDPMDLYLNYHYVDSASPETWVRAHPIRLDLGDAGNIIVDGSAQTPFVQEVPESLQDLRFWIPRLLREEDNELIASHLLVPHKNAPLALRRVLGLLIATLTGEEVSPADERVLRAEATVLNNTRQYYEELTEMVGARSATDETRYTLKSIGQLAERQLRFLKNYQSMMSSVVN